MKGRDNLSGAAARGLFCRRRRSGLGWCRSFFLDGQRRFLARPKVRAAAGPVCREGKVFSFSKGEAKQTFKAATLFRAVRRPKTDAFPTAVSASVGLRRRERHNTFARPCFSLGAGLFVGRKSRSTRRWQARRRRRRSQSRSKGVRLLRRPGRASGTAKGIFCSGKAGGRRLRSKQGREAIRRGHVGPAPTSPRRPRRGPRRRRPTRRRAVCYLCPSRCPGEGFRRLCCGLLGSPGLNAVQLRGASHSPKVVLPRRRLAPVRPTF